MIPINELLADHQEGHTEFQMEHFVVAKTGLTLYGRYRQVLRELAGRQEAVESLAIEYQRLTLELREISRRFCWTRLGRERRRLESQQNRRGLSALARQLGTARRERAHFHKLATELKTRLGRLTPERRRRLEENYWQTKLLAMAAVDFLTFGSLRDRTLEMLLALPVDLRRRTLASLQDRQQLIRWLEHFDPLPPRTLRPPERRFDQPAFSRPPERRLDQPAFSRPPERRLDQPAFSRPPVDC